MTREERAKDYALTCPPNEQTIAFTSYMLGATEEKQSSPWISAKDRLPKEGQLIAYAYLPDRSTPNAPVMYGTIYYPEPPLTDVMDYWMPLNEIKED